MSFYLDLTVWRSTISPPWECIPPVRCRGWALFRGNPCFRPNSDSMPARNMSFRVPNQTPQPLQADPRPVPRPWCSWRLSTPFVRSVSIPERTCWPPRWVGIEPKSWSENMKMWCCCETKTERKSWDKNGCNILTTFREPARGAIRASAVCKVGRRCGWQFVSPISDTI